jgi:RNA polymerase sigma-70 factor, ECF subfamily
VSHSNTDAMADAAAAQAARGDADAFATLCRLLSDDVWRYCHALLGDTHLAQEAAQETFVRAVTAIRRYRGDAPARVYLLVLARRSCGAVLRRETRHRGHDPLHEQPEPAVHAHAGHVELDLLLDDLPDDLKQAFVLTQVLGLPYDHAAAVVGCPIGTIRSRVHRARERLITDLLAADEEHRDVR